jgi:hypothetical protein
LPGAVPFWPVVAGAACPGFPVVPGATALGWPVYPLGLGCPVYPGGSGWPAYPGAAVLGWPAPGVEALGWAPVAGVGKPAAEEPDPADSGITIT